MEVGCCSGDFVRAGGGGRGGSCVHGSGAVRDIQVYFFEFLQVICADGQTVVVCVREVLQMADEQCTEHLANVIRDFLCDAVALKSYAAVAVGRWVEVVRLGVCVSELAIFDVVKQTTTTLVARLEEHTHTPVLWNVRINKCITGRDPQEIRDLFHDEVHFWEHFTSVVEDFGVGVQSWFAAADKHGGEVTNCACICHFLHLVSVDELCHFLVLHLNCDEHAFLHCRGRIGLVPELFLCCSGRFYGHETRYGILLYGSYRIIHRVHRIVLFYRVHI